MEITVVNSPSQTRESGKFTFVVINGVTWGIFSVGVSKVAQITKAKQLQQDSPSLRIRVAKITPKRRGRQWAIVVRKR